MNRVEVENYLKLVIPSVFDEINTKRKKAAKPIYNDLFDEAAQTNQATCARMDQTEVIQKSLSVVVNCCTKVKFSFLIKNN